MMLTVIVVMVTVLLILTVLLFICVGVVCGSGMCGIWFIMRGVFLGCLIMLRLLRGWRVEEWAYGFVGVG